MTNENDLQYAPVEQQGQGPLGQTREQRLQRYQDLITNFSYSLGSGLSASANARGGARNRTMAGMGAALTAPLVLQKAQEQFKAQQAAEAYRHQQTMALIQKQQGEEMVPMINPQTGEPFKGLDGQPIMIKKSQAGGEYSKVLGQQTGQQTQRDIAGGVQAGANQRAAESQAGQTERANIGVTSRGAENATNRLFQQGQTEANQQFQANQKELDRIAAQKRVETTATSAEKRAAASAANRPEKTRVVRSVDENGDTITQIVPDVAGSTFAASPTVAEQNRRDQATHIIEYGDHIMELIDKNPGVVGPVLGRLAKGERVVGNISPEAASIGTALGSLVALQPILHGFRGGQQTVEHFNQIIGDQHINAAALKASIKEIQSLAREIRKGMLQETIGSTKAAQPAAGSRVKYRMNPLTGLPEEVPAGK